MRLFVAVDLPASLRRDVDALASRMREVVAADPTRTRVTWVRGAHVHVTLHFLGDVADERVGSIAGRLSAPFDRIPFDIEIAGAGVFPATGPPRVVWLGIARGRESLEAVYCDVGQRLAAEGLAIDGRGFSPHLTLGRFRDRPRPGTVDRLTRLVPGRVGVGRVSEVVLYQSRLTPDGPVHTRLATGALAAGRP